MTCEKAFAKLNLSLDVLGKRSDGYHELCMVMESVALCDEVELEVREDGAIVLDSDVPWLPRDGRNLAVRAASVFFQRLARPELGVEIRLKKRIPVGAGMAGGSADAAAVLRGLNRLCNRPFDADALRALALEVGSDVPYCVCGGSALAMGRGEELTPLPPVPLCHVVIAKPTFSISTADLFGRIHSRNSTIRPDTAGIVAGLEAGDLSAIAVRMFNVFEDVLPRSCGEIAQLRGLLLDGGALGAVMTGTGSAVFGLFAAAERAQSAWQAIRQRGTECFLTTFTDAVEV